MIDFVYWIVILMFAVLFFSFLVQEFYVGILASMGLMVTGLYIVITGLGGYSNFLTETIGVICIVIGGYVLLRGWIEKLGDEI